MTEPQTVPKTPTPKAREPSSDSACHVVKGALVTVLNTPITISVDCSNAKKGRIAVEYHGTEKPKEDIVKKIQDEANRIIKENIPFHTQKMSRKEAEEKYKSGVNNTFIYDKFPVPEAIQEITVVELKDWNVNCCAHSHLKSTGEIGAISITGINHRASKNELEFRFDILASLPDNNNNNNNNKDKKQTTNNSKVESTESGLSSKDTNIQHISQEIYNIISRDINSNQVMTDKTRSEIESILTILKNASYSKGLSSKI
ncbi:putative alanyl-tRNA synthetase [Tieghemostelium lacteum]|uniref:Putative alanyl-tRNA synthetase n=1 Tax=Tieghemostelium lacteum TaxID=361077 RepID=A0A152A7L9_TIELA|nr:putative alanyl-tRNA synthetase [Tieghemostelium lacteum]|eukprot:KYR02229.1 putative alanyl-tRNA synthetase [Tieghemostelium lacteum]